MSNYLGIDTSNYTTSVAVYNSDTNEIIQSKKLLPVKQGARGLRQSDAVFFHTVQLPEMFEALYGRFHGALRAVGVSSVPRDEAGSYMPCFLPGVSAAAAVAKTNGIPLDTFSHQAGHVMAALYSAQAMDLLEKEFLAFHVSGGTTEALLVRPGKNRLWAIELAAKTLDLKAGQAVDRVGLMLGLSFPCGKELDKLAQASQAVFKIKPKLKGGDCCLSGVENQCADMLHSGASKEDVSKYCIAYIESTLAAMTEQLLTKYGDLPVVFAGGVMSNAIIRQDFTERFGGYFAKPEFSSDNAAGTALLSYYKNRE